MTPCHIAALQKLSKHYYFLFIKPGNERNSYKVKVALLLSEKLDVSATTAQPSLKLDFVSALNTFIQTCKNHVDIHQSRIAGNSLGPPCLLYNF